MAGGLKSLLPFRIARASARVRLVCFPFAGGAATVYRRWNELLPETVEVCAVELPGRGTRFGERPIDSVEPLFAELSSLRELPDLPTVYFGHSLGGRIAFSLIRRGFRADALIAHASRAAHVRQSVIRSSLSREALVRELRRLGGTPPAVLDDADILDLLLPVVRADFRILETLPANATDKVSCPLIAIGAADDVEVPREYTEKWSELAGGGFRYVVTEGGHFDAVARPELVLGEVRRVLDESMAT